MYLKTWDEFEQAAQNLYLSDPVKSRFVINYSHKNQLVKLKLTNNVTCLQYKTEVQQELKKIEKFTSNLMRHMASNEKV